MPLCSEQQWEWNFALRNYRHSNGWSEKSVPQSSGPVGSASAYRSGARANCNRHATTGTTEGPLFANKQPVDTSPLAPEAAICLPAAGFTLAELTSESHNICFRSLPLFALAPQHPLQGLLAARKWKRRWAGDLIGCRSANLARNPKLGDERARNQRPERAKWSGSAQCASGGWRWR